VYDKDLSNEEAAAQAVAAFLRNAAEEDAMLACINAALDWGADGKRFGIIDPVPYSCGGRSDPSAPSGGDGVPTPSSE
jgi:hypothetical protein